MYPAAATKTAVVPSSDWALISAPFVINSFIISM